MFGTSVSRKKAIRLLGVWPTIITALAIASLIVTLSATNMLAIKATPLAVPALIIWRQRKTLFAKPQGIAILRRYAIARYLSLAAIGVALSRADEWSIIWIVIFALFASALELERALQILGRFTKVYATNFSGPKQINQSSFRFGVIYQLGLLSLLLLAIGPIAPSLTPWASLALTLAMNVIAAIAASDSIRRIRARHTFQRLLPETLADLEPAFYLYWQAAPGAAFQIKMWLPYLDRIGVPYAIIVRTAANFREASRVTERPVLYRQYMSDLEEILVPSLRGVFYVNGSIRNAHMTRYAEYTHIQLNHGESDKAPSTNPTIRQFNLNFVAGQAAIDRFAQQGVAMPLEMFRIVGRPQVEDVEAAATPLEDTVSPTVLYAPTWEGYHDDANYSSLHLGVEIVQGLLDRGCTVIFRPHPYSYRSREHRRLCSHVKQMLRSDAELTGREHLCGAVSEKEMSIVDCFNASDAMISDVSSVVGDYLFSHKPLAMVATRHTSDSFRDEFPMSRAAYIINAEGGEIDQLSQTLQDLLVDDPLEERRASLATYYLGDIPREHYADRFTNVSRHELGLD